MITRPRFQNLVNIAMAALIGGMTLLAVIYVAAILTS